ncbi:EamA family transporter [Caldalkalibacillus mannanilyticus]|uniref:EamA family transporter n=1 Tax=Caldalkalibacillus mannanilyticus TaxID=1418 RepID=UPI0034E294C7
MWCHHAYKYAPAREISIFFYSSVVFAAILSLIIFKQLPDLISIFGYLVIFCASFYMFRMQKEAPTKESG